MTSRRNFVKSGLIAGLAATTLPLSSTASAVSLSKEKETARPFTEEPSSTAPAGNAKHWIWINPKHSDTEQELAIRYKKYYDAGVRGIFFEEDSEKHYRAAKAQKIEAHRWMWTMNRRIDSLMAAHPEWYAISRNGKSCITHPPYVDYYRWLCPSKPEVQKYLEDDVQQILSKDYVDGIHLDYVRYCDVILPVNLWDNYKIVQTSELPEYDFCYCQTCQDGFKAFRGIDLKSITHPDASLSWRQYRYDAITKIVNKLAVVAGTHKKPITAAVFPTPEVARRNVRQDWLNWNLSGVCPMIYHGFYKEPVEWIGDAVKEGTNGLKGKFPLYAGLYLPDFKSDKELKSGMEYAMQNGAAGISIFGDVTDTVLEILKSV
ncbi:family 10 glycosylhydrolase [Pedobacter metabolipauper]|uniref:Glycosyl hydrolase family 10 n=1 Tax=Pedobacter metabolipauper TaxID=425513 RepID=A0A4R6SZ89_9SPHI|nr:family 10 glycosylhydrolase [Pedobacter metabolipauper]TDQ11387.1 glycosyl hydrolase family 10 [Pedobacter metabolipauper]